MPWPLKTLCASVLPCMASLRGWTAPWCALDWSAAGPAGVTDPITVAVWVMLRPNDKSVEFYIPPEFEEDGETTVDLIMMAAGSIVAVV